MSLCPSCNKSNPEGHRYCTACGHELDQGMFEFLESNGLKEYLESFRAKGLLQVSDLLALEDQKLRSLNLPYGDLVRLRSALKSISAEPEIETAEEAGGTPAVALESATISPPLQVEQQYSAATPSISISQPVKSKRIKVATWIFGILLILFFISLISTNNSESSTNNENRQTASEDQSNPSDEATMQAMERARQAEQELAAMREKTALAEKEKSEALRVAAEQEAESLRNAAAEAERQKQQALERASRAEMTAQQQANQAEQELDRLRNQVARPASQEQSPNELDGLDAFFQSYINSLTSNDPWLVAKHYADSVEYGYAKSNSGRASRSEIADDNGKMFARYPQRSYSNIHIKQVIPLSHSGAKINYGFNYEYNGKKHASGSTSVWATFEKSNGRWQITGWREDVNRDR